MVCFGDIYSRELKVKRTAHTDTLKRPNAKLQELGGLREPARGPGELCVQLQNVRPCRGPSSDLAQTQINKIFYGIFKTFPPPLESVPSQFGYIVQRSLQKAVEQDDNNV